MIGAIQFLVLALPLFANAAILLTSPIKSSSPTAQAITALSPSTTPAPLAGPPTSPPTVGTFNYFGCYVDLVNQQRSLSDGATYDPAMTLEMCANNCVGFEYWGTEYGTECYCGYTLSASQKTAESDCTNPCAGNASELCGNNFRLSVYQSKTYIPPPPAPVHAPVVNSFAWDSCYTESLQAGTERTLKDMTYVGNGMTVDSCTAFCAGSLYAGLEYRSECYCGNVITESATPAPAADCYQRCAGNSTQFCGGPNRLDLYKSLAPPPYHLTGCYLEPKSLHAMPLLVSNKSVTPELCLAVVRSLAVKPVPTVYPYFGVENKKECYGGVSLDWAGQAVTSVVGKKACTKTCVGSAKGAPTGGAKCGGSKMFGLYVQDGAKVPVAAVTKVT